MKPCLALLLFVLVACGSDHHDDSHSHDDMGEHSHMEEEHGSSQGGDTHSHDGGEPHSHDDDTHSHDGGEPHSHDDDTHSHGGGEPHSHDDDTHSHDDGEAHSHDDDAHSHDGGEAHSHGDNSHEHGPEGGTETVTLWGDAAQLFVEFPVLVKGQDSPFAAHLTRLRDHYPVDNGQVLVELSGNGLPVERFSVDKPSQAGIFRVVVTPQQIGPRQVHLKLTSPQVNAQFDLGTFKVFADADSAKVTGDDHSHDSISFLLEQQWTMPFQVQQAAARNIRPNVPGHGQLTTPHDGETTLSAPANGRIKTINGRMPVAGMAVERGQALLALSVIPSQDDVDPATLKNDLEAAKIAVDKAKREYERQSKLVEQGIVERKALDDAASELQDVEADLRAAQARIALFSQNESLADDARSLRLPSPIDGVVADVYPAPDSLVEQGDALVRIVKRDQLWLDVAIPAHYAGLVKNVAGAWFQLPNIPGIFDLGKDQLVAVAPEINEQSRTLNVRFAIDNIRGDLFAGMTTQVHVIVDQPTLTTAIPFDALVEDEGRDVVYVQTGGESFEKRDVRLGVRDGAWIEVLSGVKAGEWVVAKGAYSVKLASTSTGEIGHGHAH